MSLDLTIFDWMNGLIGGSQSFYVIIIFLADYFQYAVILLFLLFIYVSRLSFRKSLKIFIIGSISAGFSRLVLVELIRLIYKRSRPFLDHQVNQLVFLNEYSFPSGHASFFFALATATFIFNKRWGALFFLFALMIGLSRIIAGVHYPTDILGGLLTGIVGTYVTYKIINLTKL